MPDPQSLAKGLMSDEPAMRAYEPSWRDRMAAALMGDGRASPARAQVVMGLMGSRGLGPTGLSAVDATPAGSILDMQQAAQHGDKAGMAMAAAGMVPGAKVAQKVAAKVAEAAPAASKGIIAYHGSPHSFDRFDMSKIGTGEGAQSYGHGLYFADSEAVAKQYRDQLASDTLKTPRGEIFDPQTQLKHLNVRVSARNSGADLDAPLARAQQLLPKASEQTRPLLEADIATLQALKDGGGVAANPGSMYQVRINADPDHFLDWDKPWAEQPNSAKDAIWAQWEARGGSRDGRTLPPFAARDDAPMESILAAMQTSGKKTGEAEAALQQAGIPGIKYLDQGSRGAGEGSRNYVVFDDKIIEIMRKYGLAGSAGAAMAAEILQRQNGGQPQGHAVAPAM